ncbi:hypothetical protein JAAARDRAFT_554549 [Jaapia argillacea MUCL 33604]|uniref:DUF974-domain-containing protein n=1 Tax=Jaapia argillacea MUCL 33604 TaxID=933084 RepID=A0A067Q348_9AGAM|nr:hypothetical protein JAAARDRAFT_554549 [Jaapia argillacea MUCL 33604]
MEGTSHPLSLKVMRVSRPALSSAWEPFYSSSPSFSAHSTGSILSLQSKDPLPGHPKTLRDLTHATDLLTLPSSFGAIQLGETFSSCLCVNNEAALEIGVITLKVEMQTVTTKLVIGEYGGLDCRLAPGDTLETVVNHEIKELGQHVLACTVSYRVSAEISPVEDVGEAVFQSFRKFYKFAVTNPLSVKTKVHTPRSPSALLSAIERERIFLEVHIQNMTQEALSFERIRFECTDGWHANDVADEDRATEDMIFSGSMALMQPQDTRQYIYILTPSSLPSFPITHPPGSIIPLGRLDISWRSSFGEPGRLLTSMLSRRIPLPQPAQQPASALPPHMQRGGAIVTPPRPRSPQIPTQPQRPATPPARPNSPFRTYPASGTIPARPQSPGPQSTAAPTPGLITSDLELDLVVVSIPYDTIRIEKPFTIQCALTISAIFPPTRIGQRRVVSLVAQHIRSPIPRRAAPPASVSPEAYSPRLPSSGFSTPSPTTGNLGRGNFNYSIFERLLVTSPREANGEGREVNGDTALQNNPQNAGMLPLPTPNPGDEHNYAGSSGVAFVGSSAVPLDRLTLTMPPDGSGKVEVRQDFGLTYLPLRKGYHAVGGLRILLIEDRWVEEGRAQTEVEQAGVRILNEWNVISEIWVKP